MTTQLKTAITIKTPITTQPSGVTDFRITAKYPLMKARLLLVLSPNASNFGALSPP